MTARVLPAAFILVALLADARGKHELAYWLVVAAVPAAAGSMLSLFGSLADVAPHTDEETRRRALTLLASLALALIVLAAAVRSPAQLDETVPALGTSALAGALCLYACQAVVAVGTQLAALRFVLRTSR
ncbi:MAG: hypothetical protein M3540_02935 [Actinomycetota bacterium]|nr:hypothetical protein [Actinomycetota bacterium]